MLRLALACALLVVSSPVWAEDPANGNGGDPDRIPGLDGTSGGIIPAGPMAPIGVSEGNGLKVGEGTVINALFGADTGFVSNVFYADTGTIAAGLFRLIAQVSTGSLSPQRLVPANGGPMNMGSFQHREELRLTYDLFLSGNDYVSGQNGLGISAVLRGKVFPQRTWSFLYLDQYERVTRSPNFESDQRINRDVNRLSLGLQYAPAGRSIRGLLHYDNTLDLFEKGEHRFANRLQNSAGVTVSWRVRPVTVLFGDVSMGWFMGIGDPTMYAEKKVDSYPLTVMTGVQTLLSLKTSLVARVGYTNGFYSAGPSFSTVTGGIDLGYRYSPLGRIAAQYQYSHQDSINANYFADHVIRLRVDQQFVPFAMEVVPELHLRHYAGINTLIPGVPDDRDDLILSVIAAARYNFRNSLAAVLQYRFTTVQTDYMYTLDADTVNPTYVRHELIAGFRIGL